MNIASPDVWFSGSCSDNISGIQYVEINITNADNGDVVLYWTNANLASNYTWWDHNFTLPYEGNYIIMVRAVDNTSNIQIATINISYFITGIPRWAFSVICEYEFHIIQFRQIVQAMLSPVSKFNIERYLKESV